MSTICEIPTLSQNPEAGGFPDPPLDLQPAPGLNEAEAVIAGGCFWCTEAVYRQLAGVIDVVSGYAGGTAETANYRAVCAGTTDHAEAIRIRYRPAEISYAQLLKVFMSAAHDPTQLNRQGNDRGRQYRSAIFHADANEQQVARAYIEQLNAAGAFSSPVVTTLEPLGVFYPAEADHQDYAARNPEQSYISGVSAPKVAKVRKLYPQRLKR